MAVITKQSVCEPRQNIVNIINFIRGVEPRVKVDLLKPVAMQMELAKQHRLPVTWLVQYDAMIDPNFVELLKDIQHEDEIGIWLEFVEPLVEKAGIKWRGRYSWDWHVNVGFSVGYSVDERKRMIDIFMKDFKEVFGFQPKAAGSWFADAITLGYLSDKYSVSAFCNCKDQWGTDGYTLWGGYFNQAYYPSRLNSFIPAQTPDIQIQMPVFRMLGSDPIHQYDAASYPNGGQSVITLEPVYKNGGGDPKWVDWFFDTIFKKPCLSFGYTQVGQENSFGWDAMSNGLRYQHKQLESLRDSGLVRVETLSKSGEWFRSNYPLTPPSVVVADQDYVRSGKGALWYSSKHYRVGLLWDGSNLCLRDLRLFDEKYSEPFLNSVCSSSVCKYDSLPILDGFLWGTKTNPAGLSLCRILDGTPIQLAQAPEIVEDGANTLNFRAGQFLFSFEESMIKLLGPSDNTWTLLARWDADTKTSFNRVEENRLIFNHEGFEYAVKVLKGSPKEVNSGFSLAPDTSGTLELRFDVP